ncbi:MAG: tetratricopeptide repeat protein, partial [Bacteroidaceae bacterium]
DVESNDGRGDKTLKLIDNFLKGVVDVPRSGVTGGETVEPGCDYSAYLEQLPDYGDSVDTPQKSEAEKEADFDRENEFTIETISRQLDEEPSEDYPVDEPSDNSLHTTDKDYFTETMAGLYIKQQKYEQALEIIEALNADNPKKSVYFADQIRYLKLLIRINRNKNK